LVRPFTSMKKKGKGEKKWNMLSTEGKRGKEGKSIPISRANCEKGGALPLRLAAKKRKRKRRKSNRVGATARSNV